MLEWIRFKLLLHVPLWIGLTVFVILLSIPDEWLGKQQSTFLILLVLSYFILRYSWRRYLKKQNKLRDASSGLFSLLFWGTIASGALYIAFSSPDTPTKPPTEPLSKLAVYADEAQQKAASDNDLSLSRKHSGKKSFLGTLSSSLKEANEKALETKNKTWVCWYTTEKALFDQCERTETLELDGNDATHEVLVIAGAEDACEEQSCQLWLMQIDKDFKDLNEVTYLKHWDNVLVPIKIGDRNTSGWLDLQIQHDGDSITTWSYTAE